MYCKETSIFRSCKWTLFRQSVTHYCRYVSIKPDQRKLLNGTNVLGLLLDILLREGFSLVSTRAVSAEEKVECYTFQRQKRPEIFTIAEDYKQEKMVNVQAKPSKQTKKR